MPVFYRLHQDQSVGTKRSGKWYARMVPTATINTRISLKLLHCLKEMILIVLPNREVMVGMERENDAVRGSA